MYAHILRVTQSKRGSEAASHTAELLPKPQCLPQAGIDEEEPTGKKTQISHNAAQPARTTEQKRRLRAKIDQTESQQARDFDFASDLLYSVSEKELPSTPISKEPIKMSVKSADEDNDINCEFDTMSLRPFRGRYFSKSR